MTQLLSNKLRKIFNIAGKKLRVSVLETTKAAGPLAKQAELVTAMQGLKEKEMSTGSDGVWPGWDGSGRLVDVM